MADSSDFTSDTLAAISLLGRSEGLVKRLRGFRKDRHSVPDAVNPATTAFFARLCADEVAEEAEGWFQRAKEAMGYKRREITLTLDGAAAQLMTRQFAFELLWALEESDPSTYTVMRSLRDFRETAFVLGQPCDAIFAGTFTDIVFTLSRGVAVEDVIDAVEALPEPQTMSVRYPANCAECTLAVPGVDAEVRCTGATLELGFPRAGSPRELLEAFGEVRSAFRFTNDEALVALL